MLIVHLKEPEAIISRRRVRDDLLTVIGYAANITMPGWPALTHHLEAGIEHFHAALALVEEADPRGEYAAYLADLTSCDGNEPNAR